MSIAGAHPELIDREAVILRAARSDRWMKYRLDM
jgi:hypothetical protein